MEYASWRDVPKEAWPWENFQPREIACRGTGRILINVDAMNKLQALRSRLNRPLIINSGYRSPQHNQNVGGARASKHMEGIAFDISMANHNPSEFETIARELGFNGIGHYPRSNFMHIDTRETPTTWGTRFPISNSNLPYEPEILPETLKDDSEAKMGLGAIGATTAAAVMHSATKEGGTIDNLMAQSPLVLIPLGFAIWLVGRHLKKW